MVKDIFRMYMEGKGTETDLRPRSGAPAQHEAPRAEAVGEVVKLELGRMASYLQHEEAALAALLAEKSDQDMLAEKKALETTLQETTARNNKVAELYDRAAPA